MTSERGTIQRVIPYYAADGVTLTYALVIFTPRPGRKEYVLRTSDPMLASLCDQIRRKPFVPPMGWPQVDATWDSGNRLRMIEEVKGDA